MLACCTPGTDGTLSGVTLGNVSRETFIPPNRTYDGNQSRNHAHSF
jgi:hypothetical protein